MKCFFLINLLFLCIVSEFAASLKLSVVFPLTYLFAPIACGLEKERERKRKMEIYLAALSLNYLHFFPLLLLLFFIIRKSFSFFMHFVKQSFLLLFNIVPES